MIWIKILQCSIMAQKGAQMDESLNSRLRRLRKSRNISATEMARRIEVPPSTYRDWESGRAAKFPPLLQISQVLAISVTELVTGQVEPTPQVLEEIEQIEKKLREIRLKLLSLK